MNPYLQYVYIFFIVHIKYPIFFFRPSAVVFIYVVMTKDIQVTHDDCMKWSLNPLVNPLSKRAILENGPKYKELKLACSSKFGIVTGPEPKSVPNVPEKTKPIGRKKPASKITTTTTTSNVPNAPKPQKPRKRQSKTIKTTFDTYEISQTQCRSFISQPWINPVSKRRIAKDGNLYQQIQHSCKVRYNITMEPALEKLDTRNVIIPEPEPDDGKIVPTTTKCSITECNTFIPHTLGAVSSRRQTVVKEVRTCTYLARVKALYKSLGICEAPDNFQASHDHLLMGKNNNILYSIFASRLHLLYGSYVVPGYWYVKGTDLENRVTPTYTLLQNTSGSPWLRNFSDLIKYVKTSGKPFHTLYVYAVQGNSAHAMALVFYYTNNVLTIGIVNPNMLSFFYHFAEVTRAVLLKHQKKHGYMIANVLQSPEFITKYQAANAYVPVSSLDPLGYCGVWSNFMMEYMAHKVANGFDPNPMKLLEIDLPPQPHSIWRKLAMDYFFTRLLDVYALAQILARKDIIDLLQNTVITKYTQKVYTGRIIQNMRSYVPGFNQDVIPRIKMQASKNNP